MKQLEANVDSTGFARAHRAPLGVRSTVDKRYGTRQVLTQASLAVNAGTVHALVGENGAGKTTLVGIIAGIVRADGGTLAFGDVEVALSTWNARLARDAGISIVQQHGAFAGALSVVENAVLGAEPVRHGMLQLGAAENALRALGDRIGLVVEPNARVDRLSPGEVQRAEIVAALHAGARLLILDEPTAVLTPIEVAGLFETLRAIAARGTTIILVTHKLDEVRQIADGITVLRGGATVATFGAAAPPAEVARAMVAGAGAVTTSELPAVYPDARPALELDHVSVRDAVHDVSLSVAAGELVGIAGVDGNGQRELALAVAGLMPHTGRIRVGNRDVSRATPATRLAAGLAYVPDDRHRGGLVLDDSIAQNLALGRRDITGRFRIDRARVAAHADAQIAALDIRPADRDAAARSLSGGNQQKIVIARELSRPSLVAVIASQPTRGLDFAAVGRIRDRLRAAAAANVGLLIISADLDELLVLCHRVVVMLRGRIVGERGGEALRDGSARSAVGELMTGAAAS